MSSQQDKAKGDWDAHRAFFQFTQDLLCIIDAEGNFVEVNAAWKVCLGYTLDDLLELRGLDLVHPLDRQGIRTQTRALKKVDHVRFISRLRGTDGMYRWISWTATRDPQRDLIYAAGRDITEVKTLHDDLQKERDTLRDRESLLRQLTDNLPCAVYKFRVGTDGSMGFTYISEGARAIFGLDTATLLRDFARLVTMLHPDDAPVFQMKVAESARTLQPFGWEGRHCKPDGQTTWIQAASQPVLQENGDIVWDGVLLDVTARREAERALETERARSLSAAKMAALGEMAAGIAHEINNPLSVISGKAQQLEFLAGNGNLSIEKAKDFAAKIGRMADRIARIVRGLRAFARDGEGDPFEIRSLKTIIDETIELCQARFQHHRVELRIAPMSSDVELECQAVQISQVILNLLNNAFDAVEPCTDGERWVEVFWQTVKDGVRIAVTDSGPGIPDEDITRIMHPFFTTKEVGKGTGLGLSIAKGIVESHQGELVLDRTSRYTRFVITLPFRQSKSTRSVA